MGSRSREGRTASWNTVWREGRNAVSPAIGPPVWELTSKRGQFDTIKKWAEEATWQEIESDLP